VKGFLSIAETQRSKRGGKRIIKKPNRQMREVLIILVPENSPRMMLIESSRDMKNSGKWRKRNELTGGREWNVAAYSIKARMPIMSPKAAIQSGKLILVSSNLLISFFIFQDRVL